MRSVRDQAGSLDEMAERGRVVPEVDEPAVRELIVGSYRLIHETNEESVFVQGPPTDTAHDARRTT